MKENRTVQIKECRNDETAREKNKLNKDNSATKLPTGSLRGEMIVLIPPRDSLKNHLTASFWGRGVFSPAHSSVMTAILFLLSLQLLD